MEIDWKENIYFRRQEKKKLYVYNSSCLMLDWQIDDTQVFGRAGLRDLESASSKRCKKNACENTMGRKYSPDDSTRQEKTVKGQMKTDYAGLFHMHSMTHTEVYRRSI